MHKHKNFIQDTTENLSAVAGKVGITLMSAAAVTGAVELPTHLDTRVVMPMQPNFVMADELNELNNPIRREREDTAPHYISYSETQRTHGRAATK